MLTVIFHLFLITSQHSHRCSRHQHHHANHHNSPLLRYITPLTFIPSESYKKCSPVVFHLFFITSHHSHHHNHLDNRSISLRVNHLVNPRSSPLFVPRAYHRVSLAAQGPTRRIQVRYLLACLLACLLAGLFASMCVCLVPCITSFPCFLTPLFCR